MNTIQIKMHSFFSWVLRFIQLQLFVTLISLPILLAWGLPLSVLSPIGNILFGPILTLFLLLSSLLFFCELLCIPNGILAMALEALTNCWLWVMHADCQTWLIGFVKPHWLLLCAIPIVTLMLVLSKTTYKLPVNILCLSLLLMGISIYFKSLESATPNIMTIPCNKGDVTILKAHNQIILIDPGYMGQSPSAASWASYTLLTQLVKTTGSTTIDHLILLQPSARTFLALERLCTKMRINKIYFPYWQEQENPKNILRAYFHLKKTADEKGVKIIRFGAKPFIIKTDTSKKLVTLFALPETIKTAQIAFPAMHAQCNIDNQEINLYSARYKKREKLL